MNIPSRKECYRLIQDMDMMAHIVAHSLLVCRVALLLTDRLQAHDIPLNRELIRAGALLHDITKTRSIRTGEMHTETGAEVLIEAGYPEVADLVRQHVRLDVNTDQGPPTEAEVVNYADKRVLHDRVALMADRLGYIMERYGTTPEYRARIRETWKRAEELEEKIFRHLDISPAQVSDLIPFEQSNGELADFQELIRLKG